MLLGVMVAGVSVHVDSVGAPVHARVITWLNPASGVTVSCRLADFRLSPSPWALRG